MADHNWHEVAARTWDILTAHAVQKRPLYYSELADELDLHHRLMRIPLDLLQDYCLQTGKPPLTIMVINKSTNQPGSGFIAASEQSIEQSWREVFSWPWQDETNPYGFALDGTTEQELVDRILTSPTEAAAVYHQVNNRGPFQSLFRKALLEAYNGRCAFSGSTLELALDAAHIVSWSQASHDDRVDIQNGLLLNIYYHRLFDRHILRLEEDYTVTLDPDTQLAELSAFDREAIQQVVGQRIKFPKSKRFFPSRAHIRRRFSEATS